MGKVSNYGFLKDDLRKKRAVLTADVGWRGSATLWVLQVLRQRSHALIDCGAMMAGATNCEVADYMCPRLDPTLFQGVVYYDQCQEKWMAKDRR
jgi:hypothetical protein